MQEVLMHTGMKIWHCDCKMNISHVSPWSRKMHTDFCLLSKSWAARTAQGGEEERKRQAVTKNTTGFLTVIQSLVQHEKKAAFCDPFSQQGNTQNSGVAQTVLLKAKRSY